jgi:hypothetical protein
MLADHRRELITLFTLYRMPALTVDQLVIGTNYMIRPAPYSPSFFGIYRGLEGNLRRFELAPNHILYLQPFIEVFAIHDGSGGSGGSSGSGGSGGSSGFGGSSAPSPPVINDNDTSPRTSNIRNINQKQRSHRRRRSRSRRNTRSRRNNNASV